MHPAIWFLAVSFSVCFLAFALCYLLCTDISKRSDGQTRSLSGIMQTYELKGFFEFAMSCLGGALLLACGLREGGRGLRGDEWCLFLLMGAYVSLIGLVKFNVQYNKYIHFSFVFSLIVCVGVLGNAHFLGGPLWWLAALYNGLAGVFLALFLMNACLRSFDHRDFRTVQAIVEISWVLCLVAVLYMYTYDGGRIQGRRHSLLLDVCLCVGVYVSAIVAAVFYLTPDIGFDQKSWVPHCLCFIIANTGPHLSFLLQAVFGLLMLHLADSDNDATTIVAVLIFVCATGFLGFDVVDHPGLHFGFVILFAYAVLVFGLYFNSSPLRDVGLVVHLTTTGAFLLSVVLVSTVFPAEHIVCGYLHIAWILGIVAMFGLNVCS